jgi:hypothetical protein
MPYLYDIKLPGPLASRDFLSGDLTRRHEGSKGEIIQKLARTSKATRVESFRFANG